MYEIIFYHAKNKTSEIIEYLDELGVKSKTSKNDRLNRIKILSYLQALSQHGTRIGSPVVKHIEGDLWELRPLKNRIFFFYWKDNKYVLLHYFIKKSKKTPRREIEKAKNNLIDFLERNDKS